MISRHFRALLCALVVCSCLFRPTYAAEELTADQANRDAKILVAALRTLHPALDKYRTRAEVEASFARFETRAGRARSVGEMYLAASELAASIRCGHTWPNVLNQQGAIKIRLLDAPDKLPLTLTLVDGRWLVLGSVTPGIEAGDELVSIDGLNSRKVVAKMLPYLRADGSSDGKRLRQLGHDRPDYNMMDIVWPLLAPPFGGVYRLGVRSGTGPMRTIDARAVTLADRDARLTSQGAKPSPTAWRFRIDGDHAVMTLPSFSVSSDIFDWQRFFANSFAELQQKRIGRLIIDIRNNEGGDGAIGLELLTYLVRAPMSYSEEQSVTTYERVPYKLARYLDTWDFSFFDRTGLVDPILEGPQAGRLSFRPNAARLHMVEPRAEHYVGQVFLLVGPEDSSATFVLAQLAQKWGAATLVGQATGGNLRGLNGGQLAWVTLPGSGVSVDIPLLATRYTSDTPDASVTPNIIVQRSFAEQAAGRDQEMEAALHAQAMELAR